MNKCIFISPHFDDICFSMSGLLQNLDNFNKTIINVFTNSCYIRRMSMPYMDQFKRMQIISDIRNNEDIIFCNKYNIKQINLGLFETSSKTIINNEQKDADILSKIENVIDFNEEQLIFVPMGIGYHEDHIQIFNIFKNLITEKENIKSKLVLYEDLPYSHIRSDRYFRIGKLSNFLICNGFKNHKIHLKRKQILEKRKDIMLYESQHKYKNYKNVRIQRYFVRSSILPHAIESLWLRDSDVVSEIIK